MARIKNMGHSSVRFSEGVIISGSAGSDNKALIITGSSVISGSAHLSALEVYSNVSGKFAAIIDNDQGSSGHGLKVSSDGTGSGTTILNLTAGTSTVFKVRGDGRIGIGVDTPGSTLSVDDEIAVGEKLIHRGDPDTYLMFDDDELHLAAGGRTFLKLEESGTDKLIVNHGALDIDFQVKGENAANLIRTDAENDSIYFGASSGAGVDNNFLISGSIGSKGTATRGTAVCGGDLLVSGSTYFNGDINVGPDTADTAKIVHNGNTDSFIIFYANDSVEFVAGNFNYLKLKEGTQDFVEFNKNQAEMDFKLWGTSDEAPALLMSGSEESIGFNAAIKFKFAEVTSFPYNITNRDHVIACGGSGARTINLPAAQGNAGRELIVKDEIGNASSGNITIDGNASENIDGSGTYVINQNKACITLICTGQQWIVTSLYSG